MTLDLSLLRASWRSWYANDLRVVGPPWLQPVWTALFSTAVGLIFFVLGLSLSMVASGRWPSSAVVVSFLWKNLTVAWTIGATIHLLFMLASAVMGVDRVRRLTGRAKSLYFGGIPLAGTMIGWPLGIALSGSGHPGWMPPETPGALGGALLFGALISLLFHLHFDAKSRQLEAERRATEAQLRLLQAQIEPHFLFNTLANVHALIDEDPARARTMLGAFTDYLRASLQGMRRDEVPLADELALAEAYLRIQRTRMEERLRHVIEADEAARSLCVPPLMLQPLVENAIQHGLEPQIQGGTLRVSARVDGGRLLIEVHDDGRGLHAPSRRGGGVALENIRSRLQARYGDDARLELLPQQPGALARLDLPLPSQADTATP